MASYKDILNTFGGDTSYADRFQAAALKGDQAWMSDIMNEYNWTASQQPPINQNQWDLGNWNYQDDSADRQEQIVSNLNEAYKQNPDQFKDWATFSQNFNYDTAWRSDKQKETMRNRYSQIQQNNIDYNDANNTDYFFGQLMSGNQLSWQWAALDAARNRYKNYQYLSGMTPEQIASAIASNSINPVWQDMQDLKNYSPALYAQVQAAIQWQTQVDDINSLWEWIYNWLTNTETNKNYTNYNFTTEYAKNASVIKQYNESLYKKIEWLWWDTAAYVAIVASMLQNPLIQANKDEIENLEWEIRKIQENIYTVWDTARSRLWSEAPEDLVSAYISQQTKDLQNQLRTAQNSLLVAQWKLNNQLTEVETMIDAINNWVKLYWEWWTWWNNYQYISWSKYQEAGYFDKSTWQFYRLWEWPDTRDYQSDDPTRLQEIRDNLDAIADSDSAYVFRDRSAFNDYFKYSQRWAAQKAVLDEFWNANAARLKPIADQKYKQYLASQKNNVWLVNDWGWWKYNRVKKAILAWTFAWKFDKQNLKQYWFNEGSDWYVLMEQVWRVATLEEMQKMFKTVQWYKGTSSESWTEYNAKQMAKRLLQWYISANASSIKNELGLRTTTKEKKEYLSSILSPIWMDTKAMRERIAQTVWAEY